MAIKCPKYFWVPALCPVCSMELDREKLKLMEFLDKEELEKELEREEKERREEEENDAKRWWFTG